MYYASLVFSRWRGMAWHRITYRTYVCHELTGEWGGESRHD